MKKLLVSLLALAMLAGCSSTTTGDDETVESTVVKIQFVPSRDVEDIVTVTDPLKEILTEAMVDKGFENVTFEISVSSDYNVAGEALISGTVDLAFLPAGTYVAYHEDGAELLVTCTRAGLSKDSENAADWNDGLATEGDSSSQVGYYRSIGVAGPSEKGQELAAIVNSGEELTWEDVNSAVWCVSSSTTSSAGYIYPTIWLMDHFDKKISDLANVVPTDGYSDTATRLASEACDIGVGYADYRRDYAEAWTTDYGRELTVWEETNVVLVTDGVMNDTISYSANSETLTPELITALQEAFIELAQTEAGLEAIAIYSHEGYVVTTDADYDSSRVAAELSQQ
ncbi:MAG: PhnD/SsuA/transferrin family substrate-binding protein [Erysipelotrichaceae bacterium]